MADWDFARVNQLCETIEAFANRDDLKKTMAIDLLTLLNDRIFPTGNKKRSSLLQIIRASLTRIFSASPGIAEHAGRPYAYIDFDSRESLRATDQVKKSWWSMPRALNPKGNCVIPAWKTRRIASGGSNLSVSDSGASDLPAADLGLTPGMFGLMSMIPPGIIWLNPLWPVIL